MALSGSVNYADNRDEIIKDALIDVGAIASEDTPGPAINEFAARKLNRMIKSWMDKGMHLWKIKRVTVLLEKDKSTYSLGPTGDHAALTDDITETAMRVAGVATDTILEVDSTTGMTAADNVGIVLDDGTIHFTTIGSITDSDTFVADDALPSAAAIDKQIYFYTNKIPRPLMITQGDGFIRDSSGNDRTITVISRQEWNSLGTKTNEGSIVEIYYDPQLTDGVLQVFNEPDNVTDSLHITCQFPLEDMDAAANNFDFPQEWLLAIQLNLALLLSTSFPVPKTEFSKLKILADAALREAEAWDAEKVSLFLQPNKQPMGAY